MTSKLCTRWSRDEVFYHIYPLGLLGAPGIDDPQTVRLWRQSAQKPQRTLSDCRPWIDHAAALGCTAVYLGPLFQSGSHGYDTIDYRRVDDRIGSESELTELVAYCHSQGLKVILDAVFNHVSRDFFAFTDLQKQGRQSMFSRWFSSIDFNKTSPYGDAFAYTGWNGHYELVKLDLSYAWVRDHLLEAVRSWIDEFDIDGLRLDAADCLSQDFITELARFCRSRRDDFLLLGELIHGDYRQWVRPDGLNAVTNYEAYKGLWSSFNDGNFFEIAWTLNRQSGPAGIYKDLNLYNFVDNHDVNRIASTLSDPGCLRPLYCLLFTVPGSPALYYGSEWAIPGQRRRHSDAPLRPALRTGTDGLPHAPNGDPVSGADRCLPELIGKLTRLRRQYPVLRDGDYRQLFVSHRQFAFARTDRERTALILVNSDQRDCSLDALAMPAWMRSGSSFDPGSLPVPQRWIDVLDGEREFFSRGSSLPVQLPGHGARILLTT